MEKRINATNVCLILNLDFYNFMIRLTKNLFTQTAFNSENSFIFVLTVPVLHTIRTAFGSFFLYSYAKQACIYCN